MSQQGESHLVKYTNLIRFLISSMKLFTELDYLSCCARSAIIFRCQCTVPSRSHLIKCDPNTNITKARLLLVVTSSSMIIVYGVLVLIVPSHQFDISYSFWLVRIVSTGVCMCLAVSIGVWFELVTRSQRVDSLKIVCDQFDSLKIVCDQFNFVVKNQFLI